MSDLNNELNTKFTNEKTHQTNEFKRGYDRMQHLEDLLKKERQDRVQSLEDQLKPIKEQMNKNFNDLETEKNARVQKEREILGSLAEDSRKIEEAIITEKEERLEMQADLVDKLETELSRQRDMIAKIKHDTLGEFQKDKRDMEKEMDNRFTHQDRTIKNISHFITTFQKTLKAVGGKQE